MALIKCPECTKDVSDKAINCPDCGYPITPQAIINEEEYLCCPKCKSKEIHAEQKGFSGGKALAGALITGGIGLLAGTIGSKDIQITCLKCNNRFKAGEAHIISNKKAEDSTEFDNKLKRIVEEQGLISAVKYYKDIKGGDLSKSKDYVDALVGKHNIKTTTSQNGGCAGVILLIPFLGTLLYLIL